MRKVAGRSRRVHVCDNGPTTTAQEEHDDPASAVDRRFGLGPARDGPGPERQPTTQVPDGARPHDVAPAPDGTVWYTAQGSGELGRLDPATGESSEIPLGAGSAPHGVIVGPDGAPWVTDGGLNAIVRVDPATEAVRASRCPADRPRQPQHGRVRRRRRALVHRPDRRLRPPRPGDRATSRCSTRRGGRGPYGITATPGGEVFYASLAGSHIARIDRATGAATRCSSRRRPARAPGGSGPTRRGGSGSASGTRARSRVLRPGRRQVAGVAAAGRRPQAYAVYVDERDMVWLSDFGANALVRFDPAPRRSERSRCPATPANVRQILGRPGEVWGAESGADRLVVVRAGALARRLLGAALSWPWPARPSRAAARRAGVPAAMPAIGSSPARAGWRARSCTAWSAGQRRRWWLSLSPALRARGRDGLVWTQQRWTPSWPTRRATCPATAWDSLACAIEAEGSDRFSRGRRAHPEQAVRWACSRPAVPAVMTSSAAGAQHRPPAWYGPRHGPALPPAGRAARRWPGTRNSPPNRPARPTQSSVRRNAVLRRSWRVSRYSSARVSSISACTESVRVRRWRRPGRATLEHAAEDRVLAQAQGIVDHAAKKAGRRPQRPSWARRAAAGGWSRDHGHRTGGSAARRRRRGTERGRAHQGALGQRHQLREAARDQGRADQLVVGGDRLEQVDRLSWVRSPARFAR